MEILHSRAQYSNGANSFTNAPQILLALIPLLVQPQSNYANSNSANFFLLSPKFLYLLLTSLLYFWYEFLSSCEPNLNETKPYLKLYNVAYETY